VLGQILIKDGVISAGQLEQALAQQRSSGALLGDILLSQNVITEEALARALAREAGVPFVSIDGLLPNADAVALVPEHFARQYVLAPVGFANNALQILQANPFDVVALDELERLVERPIEVTCGTAQHVRNLIERCYTDRSDVRELVREGVDALTAPQLDVTTTDSPVVRLLELVINDAIARGATDLHIEPEDQAVRIRHRDLFPEGRRERGDAQIDAAAVHHLGNPAVLRQPLFGDVEAAQHLEAADQRRVQLLGDGVARDQHAVNTMTDPDRLILRLDVQVGGALGYGVVDDELEEPHHR